MKIKNKKEQTINRQRRAEEGKERKRMIKKNKIDRYVNKDTQVAKKGGRKKKEASENAQPKKITRKNKKGRIKPTNKTQTEEERKDTRDKKKLPEEE